MRLQIPAQSIVVMAILALISACGRGSAAGNVEDSARGADTTQMAGMTESSTVFTAAQIAHGKVKWEAVGQSSVSGVVEVPGQLVTNDDRTARLAAPAEARVLAVHVSPGDRVAAGARLVSLQSPDASMAQSDLRKAQAEVASRRAAVTYAKSARDRAQRLLTLKAIPQQDYERAVADDELARASLSQAVAELERSRSNAAQLGIDLRSGTMTLRSPISGVITSRDVAPGAVVSPGAPLVTVSDPSTLWLAVSLPEAIASGARPGGALRFTVPTAADTFAARIQSVSGSFDPSTRSLPVRAIVSNAGGRLRPEMFARVWIESGKPIMAVTVPEAAIQRIGNLTSVFVVRPGPSGGARFEQREVEIAGTAAGRVTVLKGLKPGEVVVIEGAYAVKAQIEKSKMPDMEM